MMMRLFADNSPLAGFEHRSPGLDELRGSAGASRRYIEPASSGRAGAWRGRTRGSTQPRRVLNQHGEVAMSMKPISLIRCRPVCPTFA
jgi:hypothetical protein